MFATPRFGGDELRRPVAHRIVDEEFPRGLDPRFVECRGSALVVHVEVLQALDLVAPEFDAQRFVVGRRKDVDDRAALRHMTTQFDQILAPVAQRHEVAHQLRRVDLHADLQVQRPGLRRCDGGRRRGLLQQCTGTRDDDAWPLCRVGETPQHLESATHGFHVRTDALEGQRFPRGEQRHVAFADQGLKVVGNLTGRLSGCGGNDERGIGMKRGQRGDDGRACRVGTANRTVPARQRARHDCVGRDEVRNDGKTHSSRLID